MILTLEEAYARWQGDVPGWALACALSVGCDVVVDGLVDHKGRPCGALVHLEGDAFVVDSLGHRVRVEDSAADVAAYVEQLVDGRPLPSPGTGACQEMQDLLWREDVRREAARRIMRGEA